MPYFDREQQRAYQRQWLARRRAEWFEGKSCVDCEAVDDLQLDHVDASLKVSHKIWSWSPQRREAELLKCVVRCEPCHRLKTTSTGESRRNHAKRLTADQVRQIRHEVSEGFTQVEIAVRFGVTRTTIWDIVHGRSWTHLAEEAQTG